jgi:aryl-alcohol dehydrogenase-like predicted oxidoreductase
MKLGLGTAQFGLAYGVSNTAGQTPPDEVRAVLALAEAEGLDVLDTAPEYGTSEQALGAALDASHRFRIVTKTPPLGACRTAGEAVGRLEDAFQRSLERLGLRQVYGLLVHHAADLTGPHGAAILAALRSLQRRGVAQKIGVSVYLRPDVRALLQREPFDIVQLPLNVFDQRPLHDGTLARLKARGVEIHARSLFLQGLLLMSPDALPSGLRVVEPALRRFREASVRSGGNPLSACLGFAASVPEIDVAIVGVNHAAHLREILGAVRSGVPRMDYAPFGLEDEAILDPLRWTLS